MKGKLTAEDEKHLGDALSLARKGIGLCSPNPCVGAVVLDSSGRAAGRGFHTYEGKLHAEVIALSQAGTRARGGTLYLNLGTLLHHRTDGAMYRRSDSFGREARSCCDGRSESRRAGQRISENCGTRAWQLCSPKANFKRKRES